MSDMLNAANILNGPYDTPAIRNGAVQYVKCPHCGSAPGKPCILTAQSALSWNGRPITGFAHVGRRMEYYEWQDIYGPATESWEFVVPAPKKSTRVHLVTTLTPCSHPRQHCVHCSQCECGALLGDHKVEIPLPPKKSSDVDDLLG